MIKKESTDIRREGCLTCTWDDRKQCYNCEIQDKLDCRWEKSLLVRFYKGGSIAMISGALGLIILGLYISWLPFLI